MTSNYQAEVNLKNTNGLHTLVVELVGHNKRVLNVGVYSGYLARMLVDRGCKVMGIEADPDAARQAEEFCERIVVGDVESMDLRDSLEERSLDVIVLGKVLEHLKDPLQTLKRFEPLLQPDGHVVAIVPNIAHGSVRLAVMQGNFRYHSPWPLDNPHLSFFTREGVERMFGDAGFLVTEVRRTTKGFFDTEVEIDRERVPDEVLRLLQDDPEALTHQFVLTAHLFGEAGASARIVYELTRKLRNLEELQRMLDIRTQQLAERDQEVTKLTQQLVERNERLAKLVQSGRGDL